MLCLARQDDFDGFRQRLRKEVSQGLLCLHPDRDVLHDFGLLHFASKFLEVLCLLDQPRLDRLLLTRNPERMCRVFHHGTHGADQCRV